MGSHFFAQGPRFLGTRRSASWASETACPAARKREVRLPSGWGNDVAPLSAGAPPQVARPRASRTKCVGEMGYWVNGAPRNGLGGSRCCKGGILSIEAAGNGAGRAKGQAGLPARGNGRRNARYRGGALLIRSTRNGRLPPSTLRIGASWFFGIVGLWGHW